MKVKQKILLRVALFILIFVVLFSALNKFFQPIWFKWNNFYIVRGYYEEPKDTIETVFFGASIVINGISSTELYENYGISAYSLAMEQQPMLCSYYWLEQAHRDHSKTLKTVVLDISELRTTNTEPYYRKGLDGLKLSNIKFNAVSDHVDGKFADMIPYLIPFVSYHSRWSELEESDFLKYTTDPVSGTRGYNLETSTYADRVGGAKRIKAKGVIVDEDAKATALTEESMHYFNKMVDFCEKEGLQLVLIKTPASNWTSSHHNAVENVAKLNNLEFLDFNYDPLISEIGFVHAFDTTDGRHMNYYGATKLTNWIGNYLVTNCGATDVRGDKRYAHLEEQLKEYNSVARKKVELSEASDMIEYVKTAMNGNNTVFIIAKDEAADSFTKDQKNAFRDIGLEKLSTISYRDSYLAVIENGEISYEAIKRSSKKDKDPILYGGELLDGSTFKAQSGGYSHGNIASCTINGTEHSLNKRGLNIIVYNNDFGEIISSVNYDTHSSKNAPKEKYTLEISKSLTDPTLAEKYQANTVYQSVVEYQNKVETLKNQTLLEKEIGQNNMFGFLDMYWNDSDKMIFISAKDEASKSISKETKVSFIESYGLIELSKIAYRDSYLAVIDSGKVVVEKLDHGKTPVFYEDETYRVESGGYESGNISSVVIDGIEYSPNARGLNIVVYDKTTKGVIDAASFDTYETDIAPKS